MKLEALIAAAIYDFAAALTVRDDPITAGKNNNAAPMAQAVSAFLKERGMDLSIDPPMKTWQEDLDALQRALEEDAKAPALNFTCDLARIVDKWAVGEGQGIPGYVLADQMQRSLSQLIWAHREISRHQDSMKTDQRGMLSDIHEYGTSLPIVRGVVSDLHDVRAAKLNPMSAWPFPTSDDH